MTEHEKYQENIRHTHDAFCKTVIRHAAIDAARSIRSRRSPIMPDISALMRNGRADQHRYAGTYRRAADRKPVEVPL